jgi:tRNA A-37 threonylcarbamoyl transferase component Bud32/tetratricopeptide (TPR) repeat protein
VSDERVPSEVFLHGRVVPPGSSEPPLAAGVPEQIGQYRVVRLIGTGGMGSIYEARQEHPSRRVALKVMRPEVMTAGTARRFEYEAEVLGQLRHPGIAQVFEAGTFESETGPQPYFAMEYVEGCPLTEHAEQRHLGTRDRLELMVAVCDAVHHAHLKGVIHRDLKSANILVDDQDQPKVLDFGIARAVDSDVQTATLRTDVGQLLGTVAYMSPEQLTGDPTQLDTRSDVYALGVVTYELLTGRLPHDVRGKTIPEAARIIQQEDAPSLSASIRSLRGDVDTIVAKALDKDKERRYGSAAGLRDDILRYLRNEPIVARSPTALYQIRKFARRNRLAFAALVALLITMVAATATSTTLALVASHQRDEAIEAGERASAARDVLLDSMKFAPGQQTISISEMLVGIERAIEQRHGESPYVEAMLHEYVGEGYLSLNSVHEADEHLSRALELRRGLSGGSDRELAKCLGLMATLRLQQGRPDEAKRLIREALAMRRQAFGADHFEVAPDARLLTYVVLHTPDEPEAVAHAARNRALRERSGVFEPGPTDGGEVVLEDSFEGPGLDPAWSVDAEPDAWQMTVADSRLTLDLDDSAATGARAGIVLARSVPPLDGFRIDFHFGWDGRESYASMQYLELRLLDTHGGLMLNVMYDDPWALFRGQRAAFIGRLQTTEQRSTSGSDTLPIEGHAFVEIVRSGDVVSISWDGEPFLRGHASDPLGGVEMRFGFWPHEGADVGTGWVDLLRVTNE